MSNLVLEVVRSDDLLVLRIECVNLVLGPHVPTAPRRLVREAAAAEAMLLVDLPPQHIAEAGFTVRGDGSLLRLPRPGKVVPSLIGGPTRLAFRLPDAVDALPLDVATLLDWDAFEPLYTPHATGRAGLRPPMPNETAIELPLRLMLSPTDSHARWQHAAQPVARGDVVEVWQTQLVAKPPGASAIPMRAIWTPDLGRTAALLNSSLSKENRSAITQLSSDAKLLDLDRFNNVLTVDDIVRLGTMSRFTARPFAVTTLMLSALGGTLRAHSTFDFPPLDGGLLQKRKGRERDPGVDLFALAEWQHVATGGRDHYVRVVDRGYLYPFGHRASRITIAERRFTDGRAKKRPGERPAYLTRRSFLVVQEPERAYSGVDSPFAQLRIPRDVTSDIASDECKLPIVATDRAGREQTFEANLIFVPANSLGAIDAVRERYERRSTVELSNQRVAFIAGDAHALKTESLRIAPAHDESLRPPFRPTLGEALVHLPAAEQLGALTRQAARIAYHPAFLAGQALQGVYARIVDGLDVGLPAQAAGGLASAAMKLDGLSTLHGAVPNVDAFTGEAFGQAIAGLDGELLGGVRIRDIVVPVIDSGGLDKLPKLTTRTVPNGEEASFHWVPNLVRPAPAPLEWLADAPPLVIDGKVLRTRGSGATTDLRGTLSSFAIEILRAVRVEFDTLSFHVVTGAKPAFDVKVRSFSFIGPLAFIGELARRLPVAQLADGPSIASLPDNISAGVAISLPDVSLGMLAVQNIALAASVRIWFAAKPAEVQFSLSSRSSPFLVSYSLLGGGGFVTLTARTDGTLALEAAIELGAVVALDLVIARGEVQCMVGIYFSFETGKGAVLGGFVRLYGAVEVLRIITIAVEFYLRLTYDGHHAVGRAQLTVRVAVLGFSQSVTLTVERRFSTGALERRSADTLSLEGWRQYCEAFA